MPQRIDVPLLKRLIASPPPKVGREITDSELTGLLVKHLPSGAIRFYVQTARGKRETIAHGQGAGRRKVKREGEGELWPIDARDVLDRSKKAITLKWVRSECRRLQGKAIDGTDYSAARQQQRGIPTLRSYMDENTEGSYGWWVVANRKDGKATLARIKHCFMDSYGDLKLDQITPNLMDAWRTKRLKGAGIKKASRETCNRDTGTLKAALSKAVEWKILNTNPLADFKPAQTDRKRRAIRRLYDGEIQALREALIKREERIREERHSGNAWREKRGYAPLSSLDGIYVDELRPAVELSLETGLRKSECFGLTWSMVDFNQRVIRLKGEDTKSYTSRDIDLNDNALKVLREWKLQCGSSKGYVFPVKKLDKSFNKVFSDAGIEKQNSEGRATWHSLRHTFGSRLGETGTDAVVIMEIMGHRDLETTQRYLKASKERKRAAVEALA